MSTLPPVEHPLDEGEAEAAFGAMLDGLPSDEDIAQFLVALSDRGETASEIAGAARSVSRAQAAWRSSPANRSSIASMTVSIELMVGSLVQV